MIDTDRDGFLTRNEVTAFLADICEEYGLSHGNIYDKPPNKRKKQAGQIIGIKGICG